MSGKKTALCPGSYDPMTLGHLDIIRRAARLFDRVIVGVLVNQAKKPLFSAEDRVKMVQIATKDLPNVEVVSFSGLLVDCCRMYGAGTIVRGLRSATDFDYEQPMTAVNNVLDPEIETVFLASKPELSYVSSSVVRELALYQADYDRYLSPELVPLVHKHLDGIYGRAGAKQDK